MKKKNIFDYDHCCQQANKNLMENSYNFTSLVSIHNKFEF